MIYNDMITMMIIFNINSIDVFENLKNITIYCMLLHQE